MLSGSLRFFIFLMTSYEYLLSALDLLRTSLLACCYLYSSDSCMLLWLLFLRISWPTVYNSGDLPYILNAYYPLLIIVFWIGSCRLLVAWFCDCLLRSGGDYYWVGSTEVFFELKAYFAFGRMNRLSWLIYYLLSAPTVSVLCILRMPTDSFDTLAALELFEDVYICW